MRIAFDLQSLQVSRTGTAVYTSGLFSALQLIDSKNQYVSISTPFRLPRKGLLTKIGNAVLDLVYLHCLSPIKAAQARADVIHYPANMAPLIATAPVVVTIYDMMFCRYPETYDPLFLAFARLFIPLSARRARKVITISEFSRQDIVRFCGVSDSKVSVIYPGVSPDLAPIELTEARSFVRHHYGISALPYVLFTGELGPRKNLRNLISAIAQLRYTPSLADLQLVLVGAKHDAEYFDSLVSLVRSSGLEQVVHFLGYVPSEHLKYILSAARVVAYVSLCEGFGLPLIEAMACGTPIVASNTSSIPEVVDNAAILIKPEDVRDIALGLEQALLNEELRAALIANGLRRAQMFRWDYAATQTLTIYQELVGNDSK